MRRRCPWFVVAPLLSAQVVFAQPSKQEQAAAFFSAAEIFFQAEQYEKALESYMESYKLSNFPELLFNIGQCYRALNRNRDALKAYQDYLAAVPNSSIRKDVEKWIAELKPLAEKEPPKQAEPTLPVEVKETKVDTPVVVTPPQQPPQNTKRFLLPAGLAVAGMGMAAGALLIDNKIEQTGTRTSAQSTGRLALAIGADTALLSAAVSFLFAMRQPEQSLAVLPVSGGAILSIQVAGAK